MLACTCQWGDRICGITQLLGSSHLHSLPTHDGLIPCMWLAGRLVVLVMMLIGVVLIPVRASQLYSRLHERPLVAGHPPGDAPGCRGVYVVLSGRLSDVRGFNDFLQDFLVQVRWKQWTRSVLDSLLYLPVTATLGPVHDVYPG